MNKYVHLGLYWIVALGFSFLIVSSSVIDYTIFVGTEFLFTFIGVLVGFALTLFTHVVSLIDKLKTRYSTINNEAEKKIKTERLDKIYGEMKDDINFLFIALVLVVLVRLGSSLFRYFREEFADLAYNWLRILKESFILSIFFLCILAIKDIISISFKLSRYTVFND